MAKKSKENTETVTEEAPKVDRRIVMIEHPETGEQVNRKDYIREMYATGRFTRSQLRDHFNTEVAAKQGVASIRYQNVRAYTHDTGWSAADKDRLDAAEAKRNEAAEKKAAKQNS